MEIKWKKLLLRLGEVSLYVVPGVLVYELLVDRGYMQEMNLFVNFLVWFAVAGIADYAIYRHDKYLLKRKIKKVAREIARYKGVDPSEIDYNDIKIEEDENGTLDIEVGIKKKKKGRKK